MNNAYRRILEIVRSNGIPHLADNEPECLLLLDREGLEFIANSLPSGDGATPAYFDLLDQVENAAMRTEVDR